MAEEQKQQRELCPNLTSTKDLVNNIGGLSVDILNKEKVLLELWKNIDELTANVKSLSEEVQSLNNIKDDNEKALSAQGKRIQSLESEKKTIVSSLTSEKESVEKALNIEISDIKKREHRLEKTLKTIEAEAIINQEEVRRELMEARNELAILKAKPRKVKKKKTSTKPASA